MRGIAIALLVVVSACEEKGSAGGDCHEGLIVPEGGFQNWQTYVHVGGPDCESGYCVVNQYSGDLIDSPTEGDGIRESVEACGESCGWSNIEDRIYCTCKCGVSAGGDPSTVTCDDCPTGFECCPLLGIGPAAGDYCVRKGTCLGRG